MEEIELADCLFCRLPSNKHGIVLESEHWHVRLDSFPVNPGHLLIVSQRHITSINDVTPEEWIGLGEVLVSSRAWLARTHRPDGYNLGCNDGATAGQTMDHLHIHLIPRYVGDVANPRGGIRNFKEPMIKY